jgi:hypothetical protein
MTQFRILIRDEENDRERRLATEMTSKVAAELKIPMPRIYFYCENSSFPWDRRTFHFHDKYVRGVALSPSEIAFRSGLPDCDIVHIAAHETRHCYQWRSAEWANADQDSKEEDAETFANKWTAKTRLKGEKLK